VPLTTPDILRYGILSLGSERKGADYFDASDFPAEPRRRSALPVTDIDTGLSLMARVAIIGDSSCPVNG